MSPAMPEAESKAFQRLRKVIQLLSSGPVCGPDEVPVRICLSESVARYLLRRDPPKYPMPRTWIVAVASEPTLTGQAARILTVGGSSRFVYVDARTLSGPRYRRRRRFRNRAEAEAYVLALAADVRSRGVRSIWM